MPQTTSDQGALEIMEVEGIVPAPYLDSQGNWTFGVGHTAAAGGLVPARMQRGMPNDMDEALRLVFQTLREDLKKYEDRVNRAVRVPLKQHQFDMLVSFDLNTGGIFRAKLTEALNQGDYDEAARRFMGWLKPPEIRARRIHEMTVFRTGNYMANGDEIAIWNVDARGKLRGVREVISGPEALRRMKGDSTSKAPVTRHPALNWLQRWAA